MADVEKRLARIEDKLDLILETLSISSSECRKMGDHIDWIDGIFAKLRNPLSIILGRSLPRKRPKITLPETSGC